MTSLPERCEFKSPEEIYSNHRIGICSLTGGKCYFLLEESIDCIQRVYKIHGTYSRPLTPEELEKIRKKQESYNPRN